MKVTLKVLVALVGLFCTGMALLWIATPEFAAPKFGVAVAGVQGLSTGRADLGGIFMATAVLSFLGLRGGQRAAGYLTAAAIVMAAVAFGRAVGFAMDGIVRMTLVPFIFELLFVAILLAGARSSSPTHTD